ncbi:hypothetical protein [Candidatus Methylobacter oryzae]|uniref:Uncharacterized protein n=1 Tax=Candidatus Methylobacter oryzae TaxID=2497749 RepID=A0ABY3CGR8_9GAMM|nr:hypothetical protein [Candidatus Methylobacter oryzae]TRX00232.1 hypothetical protein EKO24_006210 [Candidatus Methylobacter oryzae]
MRNCFSGIKKTVKNWECGKIQPPRAVFICLQLFSGRLDFLGKQWRGFRILPDCIESDAGDFVRANEIKALRYAMQAVNIQRDRKCRMNENRKGVVEPLDIDNKAFNVTIIDEAARKKAEKKNLKAKNINTGKSKKIPTKD